jgi:oxygen-independent coproporphyrinogen-3 oxidase
MTTDFKSLCLKYSGRLPRYTSYPTAVEFRPLEIKERAGDFLSEATQKYKTLSLYLHLPFCPSLCYFCACNKIITQEEDRRERYLIYLEKELQLLAGSIKSHNVFTQLHLGGGSPSYHSEDELSRIMGMINKYLPFSNKAERSAEVDPRNCTVSKAAVLKDLGFNRVSLGVQDFDKSVQDLINRQQSFELTAELYSGLRHLGYRGINFDLIYGLPSQTVESFARTVEQVIALKPDRLALYGYAHVTWKVKVQNVFNKHPLPEPEVRIAMFDMAVRKLQDAGYVYIGLDHFALPEDTLTKALLGGTLRRNFMGYTTIIGDALISAGISSITDTGKYMYQNVLKNEEYESLLEQGRFPVERYLERSSEDIIRAYCIERLMCDRILSEAKVRELFPEEAALVQKIFAEAWPKLTPYLEDSFIELSSESVRITPLGSFFMRNIASSFDAYFSALKTGEKKFSQSI